MSPSVLQEFGVSLPIAFWNSFSLYRYLNQRSGRLFLVSFSSHRRIPHLLVFCMGFWNDTVHASSHLLIYKSMLFLYTGKLSRTQHALLLIRVINTQLTHWYQTGASCVFNKFHWHDMQEIKNKNKNKLSYLILSCLLSYTDIIFSFIFLLDIHSAYKRWRNKKKADWSLMHA